mmetsp:Transcript_21455/g.52120  ORF Transcript_21455/g.52120 Transcript_21455/m.52120 type:complete len:279 (+) Transcript_21455:1101-1937(+)
MSCSHTIVLGQECPNLVLLLQFIQHLRAEGRRALHPRCYLLDPCETLRRMAGEVATSGIAHTTASKRADFNDELLRGFQPRGRRQSARQACEHSVHRHRDRFLIRDGHRRRQFCDALQPLSSCDIGRASLRSQLRYSRMSRGRLFWRRQRRLHHTPFRSSLDDRKICICVFAILGEDFVGRLLLCLHDRCRSHVDISQVAGQGLVARQAPGWGPLQQRCAQVFSLAAQHRTRLGQLADEEQALSLAFSILQICIGRSVHRRLQRRESIGSIPGGILEC